MRQELVEATTPGEPLVCCALALEEVSIDAHALQFLDHGLSAEVLFGAAAEEEVLHLLIEVWTLEDAIGYRLDIHAKECA